jgi:hypothetical protein|tara:strand:+ start:1145 stop:1468 length:324 start_codon:yes stop_codon:yes gene_type:complete
VLSLLTACSSIPNLLKVDTAPVEKPELIVPSVDVYNARSLEWVVVTPENVDEVFKKLTDSKTDLVLYAITDDGYENLTLNMADIIKLLKQQQAIIAAYKKYTDEDVQ